MYSAATIRSQANGKTCYRTTTPASPIKRSYAQALAATALPFNTFGNSTSAIFEASAGNSKIDHSTAAPVINSVVEEPFRYLPTINTGLMPIYDPNEPASVAAANCYGPHAIGHDTACPDSTSITSGPLTPTADVAARINYLHIVISSVTSLVSMQ